MYTTSFASPIRKESKDWLGTLGSSQSLSKADSVIPDEMGFGNFYDVQRTGTHLGHGLHVA